MLQYKFMRFCKDALRYKHINKCFSVNSKIRFICQRMKRVYVNKFLEETIFEKPTWHNDALAELSLVGEMNASNYIEFLYVGRKERALTFYEGCVDDKIECYIEMNVFSMKKFNKERKNTSIHFRYNVRKISVYLQIHVGIIIIIIHNLYSL